MSYDLFFLRPRSRPPLTTEDLQRYFASRPHFGCSETQMWYQNEDTGVYFVFEVEPAGPDANQVEAPAPEDGLVSAGVSFNMNYVRPRAFGLEAEPEVSVFVEHFGLLVDDPQISGMGRGRYSPQGFLTGWNAGNELGYSTIVREPNGLQQMKQNLLDSTALASSWRWNQQRTTLQQSFGNAIFVPRIFYFRGPGRVVTSVIWTDAVPIALPETDYILFYRSRLAPRRWIVLRRPDVAVVDRASVDPSWLQGRVFQGEPPHVVIDNGPSLNALAEYVSSLPTADPKPEGVPFDQIIESSLLEAVTINCFGEAKSA